MLRFTIRDLFWLTLVAGLALGWWVAHGRWAEQAIAADFKAVFQEQRLRDAQDHILVLQSEVSFERKKLWQALQILELENGMAPNLP